MVLIEFNKCMKEQRSSSIVRNGEMIYMNPKPSSSRGGWKMSIVLSVVDSEIWAAKKETRLCQKLSFVVAGYSYFYCEIHFCGWTREECELP